MIEIQDIKNNSIAEDLGLSPGDQIISINDNKITDFLDLNFYESKAYIDLIFMKNEEAFEIEIEKPPEENLGVVPEKEQIKTCSNDCVFCFIKQNPAGLRDSLYISDEDYRYSFLYGNFVTLTDAEQSDLDRIVEQKLSPLYISVHATDEEARRRLFQSSEEGKILDKIEFLADNGIEMHTQIVLVPGYNDKNILEQTIQDLAKFRDAIKSVAIVPVGLTKHREGLTDLDRIQPKQAEKIIMKAEFWEEKYSNKDDNPFVYLADEIYLTAEVQFPEEEHYGDYYQLDNGVGLARKKIEKIKQDLEELYSQLTRKKKILIVTGESGEQVFEQYLLPVLNKIKKLDLEIFAVKNNFFGRSVTVSGLLTGKDIIEQVQPVAGNYNHIFLPSVCVNKDGLLLDDTTPGEIEEKLETEVSFVNDDLIKRIMDVS